MGRRVQFKNNIYNLDCCYSGADKPGSKGSEDKANDETDLFKNKSKTSSEYILQQISLEFGSKQIFKTRDNS